MNEQVLHPKSEHHGNRIDVYLANLELGLTRSAIKALITKGNIFLNGERVTKAGVLISSGDTISIKQPIISTEDNIEPQDIPLDIVYQDNDIAVINKPQGMTTHPGAGNSRDTLANALLFHFDKLSTINGVFRPGIVHRLDKDTSGLLIIAKNDASHAKIAADLKAHKIGRYYTALLQDRLGEDSGEIATEIGRNPKDRKKMAVVERGRGSLTSFKVLQRYEQFTLVEFQLYTGRTHQIRVHAKHIQHPVVGDKLYGSKKQYNLKGQLLHASKLEFNHPLSGHFLSFTSELPRDFSDFLAKLKK